MCETIIASDWALDFETGNHLSYRPPRPPRYSRILRREFLRSLHRGCIYTVTFLRNCALELSHRLLEKELRIYICIYFVRSTLYSHARMYQGICRRQRPASRKIAHFNKVPNALGIGRSWRTPRSDNDAARPLLNLTLQELGTLKRERGQQQQR